MGDRIFLRNQENLKRSLRKLKYHIKAWQRILRSES